MKSLKQQRYEVRSIHPLNGNVEKTIAVRNGEQIKPKFRSKNVGDSVLIKPNSESYVIRVK